VTRDEVAQLLLACRAGGLSFYGRIDTEVGFDAAVTAYSAVLGPIDTTPEAVLAMIIRSGAKDMPSIAELHRLLAPPAADDTSAWAAVMERVHRVGLMEWDHVGPFEDPVCEEVASRFGARAFCLMREGSSEESTLRAQFRDAYRGAARRHEATSHGLALDPGPMARIRQLEQRNGRPVLQLLTGTDDEEGPFR